MANLVRQVFQTVGSIFSGPKSPAQWQCYDTDGFDFVLDPGQTYIASCPAGYMFVGFDFNNRSGQDLTISHDPNVGGPDYTGGQGHSYTVAAREAISRPFSPCTKISIANESEVSTAGVDGVHGSGTKLTLIVTTVKVSAS